MGNNHELSEQQIFWRSRARAHSSRYKFIKLKGIKAIFGEKKKCTKQEIQTSANKVNELSACC